MNELALWIGFNILVVALLALDLFVFHREAHEVNLKEAAGWSVFWIALALLFNAGVYYFRGPEAGLEFLTGYLIEKALSVDNIFVFVLIFAYFAVPPKYQHRVLFWGILGALVMRGAMIFAGADLLHRFHWLIYLFGAFLVFTGFRMATPDRARHPSRSQPRDSPGAPAGAGDECLPRPEVLRPRGPAAGRPLRLMATPLFVVLVLVETTDLIFAVDSIPAIFAVTDDPLHRLHVERLRHPRPPGAVLPAGRGHPQVPLPAAGPGGGAGLRGRQDAAQRHLSGAGGHFAGRHRPRPRHRRRRLALVAESARGALPRRARPAGAGELGQWPPAEDEASA